MKKADASALSWCDVSDRFYLMACESCPGRRHWISLHHAGRNWTIREAGTPLHDFLELLMIAFARLYAAGKGAVDMAIFGKAKEPCLRGLLKLANGLPPSHETFSRLSRRLDPDQFGAVFQRFMMKFSTQCQGVIGIDDRRLQCRHGQTGRRCRSWPYRDANASVSTDVAWLQKDHQWPGLTAIGKVVRIRETPAKTTSETAYYLLSAALSPDRRNEVARQHWGWKIAGIGALTSS